MKKYESAQQGVFQDKNVILREHLSFDSGRYDVEVAENPGSMLAIRIPLDWLHLRAIFVVRYLRERAQKL